MAWDKKFWDDLFEGGREYYPVNRVYFDLLMGRLVEKVGREPKSGLDIACGTGQLAQLLAERGLTVAARDLSTVALGKAAERFEKMPDVGARVTLGEVDFDRLDPEDVRERFDLIFIKLAYTFVAAKPRFLRWVKASLRDGGVFVLMTPVLAEGYEHDDFEKKISVPRREAEKLLRAEFSDVEIFHEFYPGETGGHVDYLLTP